MCAETEEELCMYEQECAVTVGSPGWDGMMEDGRRLRLSRVLVRRWAASRMRPRDLEVTARGHSHGGSWSKKEVTVTVLATSNSLCHGPSRSDDGIVQTMVVVVLR
jgi:hypothetical protein